nr:hypothetical protein [Frankia sp. R43]
MPAEQASLERVEVVLRLLSRDVAGTQYRTDAIEHGRRDERGMPAVRVLDTGEGDDTDVVLVGEHLVHVGFVERPLRPFSGGPVREAAMGEFLGDGRDRPFPGGELLESPLDKPPPVGVERDIRDVAPFGPDPDVEVADRGEAGGSAVAGLLRHLVGDVLAACGRLILVDRGHDSVEKLPGRGLVDVLRCGDEKDAEVTQPHREIGILVPVACEPVQLVDDHDIDIPVCLDTGDHREERLPLVQILVGGRARFHVLVDNIDIDTLRLFAALHPLRGKRDPLRVVVRTYLRLGGNPEVEHGAQPANGFGGRRNGRFADSGRGHGRPFRPKIGDISVTPCPSVLPFRSNAFLLGDAFRGNVVRCAVRCLDFFADNHARPAGERSCETTTVDIRMRLCDDGDMLAARRIQRIRPDSVARSEESWTRDFARPGSGSGRTGRRTRRHARTRATGGGVRYPPPGCPGAGQDGRDG